MKAAVIGGDAAGLTIAWLLSAEMEVDLYEKGERLGGSLGKILCDGKGQTFEVERGETYFFPSYHKNILRLLNHLNIYTEPQDASYGYRGETPFSAASFLFSNPKHKHSFSFRKIESSIVSFMKRAVYDTKERIAPTNLMLKQYLMGLNIEPVVMNEILPAFFGLLWHCRLDEAREISAERCLNFLAGSNLLNRTAAHEIRFIPAGFEIYINKLLFKGSFTVHRKRQIKKVRHHESIISITDEKNNTLDYNQVIISCSADKILALLEDLKEEERNLFKAVVYSSLPFVLHQDTNILPQDPNARKKVFVIEPYNTKRGPDCAYHINLALIQNAPRELPLYLSANYQRQPATDKIFLTGEWRKPKNSRTVTQAVENIKENIQGRNGIWFCGNYIYDDTSEMTTGIGAALHLAKKMNLSLPFRSVKGSQR